MLCAGVFKQGKEKMQFDDIKPIAFKAVWVWLADGTRTLGMWTGEKWWSAKGSGQMGT
jgi:hypothetical protein